MNFRIGNVVLALAVCVSVAAGVVDAGAEASGQWSEVVSIARPSNAAPSSLDSGWSLDPSEAGRKAPDVTKIYISNFEEATIHEYDPVTGELGFLRRGVNSPQASSLLFDIDGGLLVGTLGFGILKLNVDGSQRVVRFPDQVFGPNGLAMDSEQRLYYTQWGVGNVVRASRDGSPDEVFVEDVFTPDGLAFDNLGSLYVTDRKASVIYRVPEAGVREVFAETTCRPSSIQVAATHDIYFTCINGELRRYVGGDPQQVEVIGDYYTNGFETNTAIHLTPDEASLYYTAYADGSLLSIDLETGDFVELIPEGTLHSPVSIGVFTH